MKKYYLTSIILMLLTLINVFILVHERVYIFDYTAKKFKNKNVVIFGDSRVQNGDWGWHFKSTKIQKSGFPGFTTSDLIPKVKTDIISYHPKKCIIQAGINDILLGVKYNVPLQSSYNAYKHIIDTLSENKIVTIIESVIYVNSSNTLINKRVDSLNTYLKNYCIKKNITFIDLNKELSSNHNLNMKYSIGDGVHFNKLGYSIMYQKIKPYLN